MALPVEINPLHLQTSGGYSVSKSLRFRSSASAYLNRTPSVAGSRQKFTISAWLKRGTNPSTGQILMAAGTGTLNQDCYLCFGGSNTTGGTADTLCFFSPAAGNNISLLSTALYRDFSAWYHVVVAVDTTQATASNRVLMYINGVKITSFTTATYPTLNQNLNFNNTTAENIGASTVTPANFFDGYLAEFNFIDGQALTPSSFGAYDLNGVWQPAKYSGTYGTNGFYLPFTNTTSTATLGNDSSGNSNTWTVNNISLTAGSTYDSMTDSPTVTSASVANYAVLNPLNVSGGTYQDGNLTWVSPATDQKSGLSTIPVTTAGSWYCEITAVSKTGTYRTIGVSSSATAWVLRAQYRSDGATNVNGTAGTSFASYTTGDIIGVTYNSSTGVVTFYKNNVSQGTLTVSSLTTAQYFSCSSDSSGSTSTYSANFGQRPFTYTPPTGFNALNTYNLPTPAITNGAKYFAATTYTGNGSTQTITNGGNNTIGTTFRPDLLWVKRRDAVGNHSLQNSTQGSTVQLSSNSTSAAVTDTTEVTSFNANGFSVGDGSGAGYGVNISTGSYIGWQWVANSGSTSSNTNGSITSTVQANTTAGFSIVTYTATGANATVGHGLGVAPSMYFVKNYASGTTNYPLYHIGTTAAGNTFLNASNAYAASATIWNSTAPTSTVFSVGNNPNLVAGTTIAYCFAEVAGYSAFGSYTGNASTDGTFVYTGFRPRWVLLKDVPDATAWFIFDSSRDTYNVVGQYIQAQSSSAEATQASVDFLSNGFKLRVASDPNRAVQYIYAAFAENPFNSSRAR